MNVIKTMSAALVLAAICAIIAACHIADQDRQIALLRIQILDLPAIRSDVINLSGANGRAEIAALLEIKSKQETNDGVLLELATNMGRMNDDQILILDRLAELSKPRTDGAPRVTASARPIVARPVRSSAQMYGALPAAVSEQITRKAIEKWPNDFSMQEYEIRIQSEAYRKINPPNYSLSSNPEDLEDLLSAEERDWKISNHAMYLKYQLLYAKHTNSYAPDVVEKMIVIEAMAQKDRIRAIETAPITHPRPLGQ
jgi:hypothetical protein